MLHDGRRRRLEQANYDGRKYPECAPYLGHKGQTSTWNTFVRDFGSAMSMREVSDDSLEDCLYTASTLAGTNG